MIVLFYIISSILFLVIGILSTYIYFSNKKYDELRTELELLKEIKDPVNIDKFNELKERSTKLEIDNDSLVNEVDRLKSYLGLTRDKEYGIIKRDLVYSSDGSDDIPVVVTAEFKTIQRGSNKIKISVNIDTIKTEPNLLGKDQGLAHKCKEYMDDWYDIDDSSITWIIPEQSIKREYEIDNILGE